MDVLFHGKSEQMMIWGYPNFWKPPSGGYTILEVIFDPSKMDGLRIC